MIVVDKIVENIEDIDLTALERDPVRLYYDELNWTDQKLKSVCGTHVMLALPTGTHMHDGDILFKNDKLVIYVDLISEKVVHVFPEDKTQWARVAYNIGRMQKELFLKNDGIYAIYGTSLVNMLDDLAVYYQIETAKLEDDVYL